MERKDALPETAAVCGLYCEACSLFIASHEDPERLKRLAAMYGMTPEQISCDGCRSDKLGPYCVTCRMKPCAEEHGVSFCRGQRQLHFPVDDNNTSPNRNAPEL